jgi:hypothetical protein
MPPDTITKVIPTATIALMLVCSTTLTTDTAEMRCQIHSAAHSSSSPISVPN